MGVNETQRLYVRVPFKIVQELQIKELHPDIKRVVLARQKNARWCHIEFENNEKCIAALKQLKKTKIEGKSIVVATAEPRDDSFIKLKSKKYKHQKTKSTESAN